MQAEDIERGKEGKAPKKYRKEGAIKRSQYADPKRFKYPLHRKENASAALRYFSKPKNRSGYSDEEVKKIAKRIINACKKFGIEVSEESYKTFGLKKSYSFKDILELRKNEHQKGLKKALEVRCSTSSNIGTSRIRKAKYIKRTGSPGRYKYIYKELIGKRGKTEAPMISEKIANNTLDAINFLYANKGKRMEGTNYKIGEKVFAEGEKSVIIGKTGEKYALVVAEESFQKYGKHVKEDDIFEVNISNIEKQRI